MSFDEAHEKDKRVCGTITCEICGHEANFVLSHKAVLENVTEKIKAQNTQLMLQEKENWKREVRNVIKKMKTDIINEDITDTEDVCLRLYLAMKELEIELVEHMLYKHARLYELKGKDETQRR